MRSNQVPPAIASIPWLGFILQIGGAGSAAGLIASYRAVKQNPQADTFIITARWTMLGLAIGSAAQAVDVLI